MVLVYHVMMAMNLILKRKNVSFNQNNFNKKILFVLNGSKKYVHNVHSEVSRIDKGYVNKLTSIAITIRN